MRFVNEHRGRYAVVFLLRVLEIVVVGARSAAQVHRNAARRAAAVPDDLWAELEPTGLVRSPETVI